MTIEKFNQAIEYLKSKHELFIHQKDDAYIYFEFITANMRQNFEISIRPENTHDLYNISARSIDFTVEQDPETEENLEKELVRLFSVVEARENDETVSDFYTIEESGLVYFLKCELFDDEISFESLETTLLNMTILLSDFPVGSPR